MKKNLLASLAVASTIGFFTPVTSQAFGLGKLELMSALNEPFKAEIDVTALRVQEKDNLQVKIASNDEFLKAGLDRSILLSQLQFDIVSSQGETKILVTSKQSVKEPFLDFLLTATAGSGRLIREYTVLLDPPAYVMAESRGTSKAASASQAAAETTPSTTTRYQYAESSYTGSSYAVKRSDTLWNIALKTRANNSISVHQMMMGLLRENPSAFSNGNVNGLKAGVTLQIPTQNQITAISKSAATAQFAEQTEAWKNRNKALASVTTLTEPKPTEQTMPEAGAETAMADETSSDTTTEQSTQTDPKAADAAVSSDNDGRLQLVAPEEDVTNEDDAAPNVAGDDQINKLTEQLTLAEETIEAQQQENVDFEARMDAMEEQLETMRRLISLKDADLARLQSNLEQEAPALATDVKAELQTAEADTESLQANDEPPETAAETTEVAQQTPVAQTDSEAGEKNLISDAAKALNLDEKEVDSVVDKVKQFVSENKLQTALGLLLILLILWLIARRSSREVTWNEAVKKMDKQKPEHDGPVVVSPVSADKENVTDAPLADDVDDKSVAELVEQADMFVGYADYVQAKNALEQARLQEPENTLVAYKMLFVLYKQQQVDAFVTLAEEAEFDTDSFEWDEIKQWGQELSPNHELFKNASTEQSASKDEPELADLADTSDSQQEYELEDGINLAETDEPETVSEQDEHIEFDLNDFDTAAQVEQDETDSESEQNKTDQDDDLLSFDNHSNFEDNASSDEALDLDIANDAVANDNVSFDMEDADEFSPQQRDNEIDEDAPDLEFDVGDLDDIDEAETKLDLAAAYIDMDDPDGAKSILNEVLVEGNEEQKNRAHSLLDSLS